MKIKRLAFGLAKDIFGAPGIEVALQHGQTVGDLRLLLEAKFSRLASLSSYMIAVNNEYADRQQELHEADEVAIIPPVSGG